MLSARANAKLKAAKVKDPEKSAGVMSLSLEDEKLRKELSREQDTQKRAADNLRPGVCEKAVKKK